MTSRPVKQIVQRRWGGRSAQVDTGEFSPTGTGATALLGRVGRDQQPRNETGISENADAAHGSDGPARRAGAAEIIDSAG